MCYQIEIIHKEDCSTSRWSGGTTTQLYIYPPDAVYQERNFLWRLSSAKVEIAESDFTPLPGFERVIMILDGELFLSHTGQYEVLLKPYEQDTFQGAWQTKSRGLVTDFNLMTSMDCRGSLTAIKLKAQEEITLDLADHLHIIAEQFELTDVFYVSRGSIQITLPDDKIVRELNQHDLMLIRRDQFEKSIQLRIKNSSDSETMIVQAGISYQLNPKNHRT